MKVECDFPWQAQHFVTFWEIAGARNVVFFNTKLSPRSHGEGLRSGGCEMTILSSDILGYRRIILESSLYWRKQFRDFALQSCIQNFVAGAVFGEVGGWLCLLRALEPRDPYAKDDLMHVSNKHLLKIGHENPYDREVARNSVKLLCYKMLQQHLAV